MNNQTIISILKQSQPFKYLNEDDIQLVLSYGEILKLDRYAMLLQQGSPGQGLYIVLSGTLAVTAKLLAQGDLFLSQYHSKDAFGEISLLINAPCTASVKARTKVFCYFLRKDYFNAIALIMPAIHHKIEKGILDIIIERQHGMFSGLKKLLTHIKPLPYQITFKRKIKKLSFLYKKQVEKLAYLKKTSVFSLFNEKEFNEIISASQLIKTDCHSILNPLLDKKYFCFFILSGSVHMNLMTNKKISKITVFSPHAFIFPFSLIYSQAQEPSYLSYPRTVLLGINKNFFQSLMKNIRNENLKYKFFHLISLHFASLQNKFNMHRLRLANEKYEIVDRRT